jgi:hypothetical protein
MVEMGNQKKCVDVGDLAVCWYYLYLHQRRLWEGLASLNMAIFPQPTRAAKKINGVFSAPR